MPMFKTAPRHSQTANPIHFQLWLLQPASASQLPATKLHQPKKGLAVISPGAVLEPLGGRTVSGRDSGSPDQYCGDCLNSRRLHYQPTLPAGKELGRGSNWYFIKQWLTR